MFSNLTYISHILFNFFLVGGGGGGVTKKHPMLAISRGDRVEGKKTF